MDCRGLFSLFLRTVFPLMLQFGFTALRAAVGGGGK